MAKKQKKISPSITYGFVGLIGVLTLVLGSLSLARVIQNPAKQIENARLKALKQASVSSYAGSDTALKNKDTDQDGLSDYDELNIYGTSPYLPDSDSDGFTDSQELESGNDPNCPTGQNCRSSQIVPPDQQQQVLDNLGVEQFGQLLDKPTTDKTSSPSSSALDLNSLTPEQIRKILLESGDITQEQLDQIDDEALLKIYKEVISSNNNQ